MQFRGKLKSVTRDIVSGEYVVSFATNECLEPESCYDDVDVSIKQHREKRSLTANGYYWSLISKLAPIAGMTLNEMHNFIIRRYGKPEMVAGTVACFAIPDTDEAEQQVMNADKYHLKPTSKTKESKDGRTFRIYILMKPTHTMDSKEFSELLDGVISECKQVGIETVPRTMLEEMMRDYEKHYAGQ